MPKVNQPTWTFGTTKKQILYIIINILFSSAIITTILTTKDDQVTQPTLIIDVLTVGGFLGLLYYQYLAKWYVGVSCIAVTLTSAIVLLVQDRQKHLKTNTK